MELAATDAPGLPPEQRDSHGRVIDYLRVSVTDRCNERCFYCMPDGYKGWASAKDRLSADEIVSIVATAAGMGFRKVRLTGGEPLVRPDIVEIAARIWEIPGIEALGISTNGTMLAPIAMRLKRAGVRAVNVSLDALDPERYRQITGGNLAHALDGIEAARQAGFEVVKLNCVLLRGLNDDQIAPLAEFGAKNGFPVRFIELMPMAGGFDFEKYYFPVAEAMRVLAAAGELRPDEKAKVGHGPAKYYRFGGNEALVGFIGALTTPHFCASCNKLRLTSDGKLRPCLGRTGEIDLHDHASAEEAFRSALAGKPEDHTFVFGPDHQDGRPMTAIGG